MEENGEIIPNGHRISFWDDENVLKLDSSTGEGNGNPFQYSCLENPKDRGISWVTVCGIAKSRTLLSDFLSLSNRRYHCMAKAENIWVIDCIATLIKNNVQ